MPLKTYYCFPIGSFQKMTNYTVPVSPNQICSSEQSTPGTSTVCYPPPHKSSTSPVPADWRCIPDLKNECDARNYALLVKEICKGNPIRTGTEINGAKLATLVLGLKAQ
jgi:hypothetical protein